MPRTTVDERRIALIAAVRACDGVATVPGLLRAGHSRYDIAGAVEAAELLRVRRGWVAVPGADGELVAAARGGVVLSCITQARRRGLWVLEEDRCHVAADPHGAGRKPARATVHWAQPLVPRPPGALEDPIENVLALVASCQRFEVALAVWESALNKRLVLREALARLTLPTAARRVLEAATPFADSGLETIFRERLRWMKTPIRSQIWIDGAPVDLLIGDRLVVQIDGGHHVGLQRGRDLAHDARLASLGYTVLRFTYAQIIDDWPAVQDAVMRAVAAGLHRNR